MAKKASDKQSAGKAAPVAAAAAESASGAVRMSHPAGLGSIGFERFDGTYASYEAGEDGVLEVDALDAAVLEKVHGYQRVED
jgi:hypothetical protein